MTDHVHEGKLERVVTVKGFDATDQGVDREELVVDIVRAVPVPLNGVEVHEGFLEIAMAIYEDVRPYIDSVSPSHGVILNGHR